MDAGTVTLSVNDDKGVAVEQGTYDELMAMNGVFVKQVERQIS